MTNYAAQANASRLSNPIIRDRIEAAGLEPREIRGLLFEARRHGDDAMAAICTQALRGDEDAITECAFVISTAAPDNDGC